MMKIVPVISCFALSLALLSCTSATQSTPKHPVVTIRIPEVLTEEKLLNLGVNIHQRCAGDDSSEVRRTFCFCVARTVTLTVHGLGISTVDELHRRLSEVTPGVVDLAVCAREAFTASGR